MLMFGKKTNTQDRTDAETREARLIAKAMSRLSADPQAYEAIRAALQGRSVSELSERELISIINRAIAAAQ
jgi:hypothetical protein